MGRCKLADIKYNHRKVGDTMKEKLEKMKKDVPAVFLAMGKKGDALVCKTVCGADGKMHSKLGLGAVQNRFGGHLERR